MNITRRSLLKALGIAPVIAAIPVKGIETANDGIMLNSIAHVKTEGASIKSLEDIFNETWCNKPSVEQLF